MTIACCYVSPEGVVFGADSTASVMGAGGAFHYYNHAQKIFEVGINSTLGLITWGLSGLQGVSTRTLIAELDDGLKQFPAGSVREVAERWAAHFDGAWATFAQRPQQAALFARCRELAARPPFASGQMVPGARSFDEEAQFQELMRQLTVGFCVGGNVPPDRTPRAYFLHYTPLVQGLPAIEEIVPGTSNFWGAPNRNN